MGTWCAVMAQVKYSINEHWLFWQGNEKPDAVPAEDWRFVDLPHTWNERDAVDDVPGYYRGAGWYRKNLSLDETAKGKQIYLFFEGADQKTELYTGCRWTQIRREFTQRGIRRTRTGFAFLREEV